jgi:uncharacterized protein YjiS (DUF1127 family)
MLIALIRGLWQSLSESYNDWSNRQRAYAELSGLDDRSLADIGISRGEIPYILSHPQAATAPVKPAVNTPVRHAA